MRQRFFIQDFGLSCSLGQNKNIIYDNWLARSTKNIVLKDSFSPNKPCYVATVNSELPAIPNEFAAYECRNNQLLLAALEDIEQTVANLKCEYANSRIGVVLGTSTSGIATGESALSEYLETGSFPDNYHFNQQKVSGCSEFLQRYLELTGPALTVSTACSSGANAMLSARRLLQLDLCDAVIVGAADSLCQMTVQGFQSLESISSGICQPFSANRNGITIGEGAALYVLSKEPAAIELYGVGCSADAHHVSAPDPSGRGAIRAMQHAIAQSPFETSHIDYLNLHGTATQLNDAMESKAVANALMQGVPCTSTKSLTGHTLGAAAAIELGLCCILLSENNPQNIIPAQSWDGCFDPHIDQINIISEHHQAQRLQLCLSNSFAFGGNNASLLVGHAYEYR